MASEEVNRLGHVIGLSLGCDTDVPFTIDGAPVKYVSDIKIDAPPHSLMTVTVTILASAITGVEPRKESIDE